MAEDFRLDTTGLFGFKTPIGLGPHPETSTLTKLVFGHFELQGETLEVLAVPALAKGPAASDQGWLDRISRRWQRVEWRLIPARPGEPVSAGGETSAGEGIDRCRVIRGPKLDVLIVHRSRQDLAPGTPSAWIETIAGSLKVPANDGDPTLAKAEDVMPHLEAACAAVERQHWEAVLEPAMRAVILGTKTLVASICLGVAPEVPAAFVTAQAKLHLGHAAGDVRFIREAEFLAIRSLNTLRDLRGLNPASLDHYSKELSRFLDYLGAIQGTMHPERAAILKSANLVQRANARGELCFELARKRTQQGLDSQALSYAETSVQDLSTYMAWIANYPPDERSRQFSDVLPNRIFRSA
jgi:hypothetical protein